MAALEPIVEDLKAQGVDLIFSTGTPPTVLANDAFAGTDTPIIFAPVNDPVGAGLVTELNSPGGNSTGVQGSVSTAKSIEYLLTIMPEVTNIYAVNNPSDKSSVASLVGLSEAAEQLGIELIVRDAASPEEIQAAAADVPTDADAIFIVRSGSISAQIDLFIQAGNELQIPVFSTIISLVEPGALFSYGQDYYAVGVQAARLADQAARGIPVSELPVEVAESFLYINQKAAQSIGIDIPEHVLEQAHTVIRD